MSTKASASPRAKAHKLKVASTKNGSTLKRKLAKKSLIVDTEEDPDYDNDDNSDAPTYSVFQEYRTKESPMKTEVYTIHEGAKAAAPKQQIHEDYEEMYTRLSQAVSENTKMRAKLRAEMEEKYGLEQKVITLTDKLVEAKRGLQDTSFALQKVQLVTSQLMSKKDEREMKLQEAMVMNNAMQRRIAELERELKAAEASKSNTQEQSASSASHAEIKDEKSLALIQSLEEQLASCKEQLAILKRDNVHLTEEKADAQYLLEAKANRISLLEERLRASEAKIFSVPMEWMGNMRDSFSTVMSAERGSSATTAFRPQFPLEAPVDQSPQLPRPDVSSLESKLSMLETDKTHLEHRLQTLERQLSAPVLQQENRGVSFHPTVNAPASNDRVNTVNEPQLAPEVTQEVKVIADTFSNTVINARAPQQMMQSPSQRSFKVKRNSLAPVFEQEQDSPQPAAQAYADVANGSALLMPSPSMLLSRNLSTSSMDTPMSLRRDTSELFHQATEEREDVEDDPDQDDNPNDVKKKIDRERKVAKRAIVQWYKDFVSEHNREPTKVERDMYVGEIYKNYRRNSKVMKQLVQR